MPKIRYLHKTRQGIPGIYPKQSDDILQNMNFSRYYRKRGKYIYGFDPNIMLYDDIDRLTYTTEHTHQVCENHRLFFSISFQLNSCQIFRRRKSDNSAIPEISDISCDNAVCMNPLCNGALHCVFKVVPFYFCCLCNV